MTIGIFKVRRRVSESILRLDGGWVAAKGKKKGDRTREARDEAKGKTAEGNKGKYCYEDLGKASETEGTKRH